MSNSKTETEMTFGRHAERAFIVMLGCMVIVFVVAIAFQDNVTSARAVMFGWPIVGIEFWTAVIGFIVGLIGSYIAESDPDFDR